ncbi:MAG TPA: helix-turn-helix transcriptional regulator [Prolixibacteraceae bacterium]|jgi:DNA-binding CsgD family transcriptional regulator
MNNRTYKIVVICSSDIILKGLGEILNGCNSDEIILLHRANELNDYPHLSGYLLLIMPANVFKENEGFLKRVLSSTDEVRHLQLTYEGRPEIFNTAINIEDNHTVIVSKVNELLNSFGAKNDERALNELTKREIDVLQLVAKGLANKEVADKLCISIHTVISHRKNISEKTGIKSASGLTMYAVIKKIIDIDEITTSDLI